MSPSHVLLFLMMQLLIVICLGHTNRPIIGILSQPTHDQNNDRFSYIAASYVKFVESSGARAVPIHYDMPKQDMKNLFSQLNGVLFPGGSANLNHTLYIQVQQDLVNWSMEAYDTNGDLVPVWATCLGFEALAIIFSDKSAGILDNNFDSWNLPLPLDFTDSSLPHQSRMFHSVSKSLFDALQKDPITMNNHHSGVTLQDWQADSSLMKNFRVISTNKDRKGRVFISTIEHYKYPIYGVQWHPEKNAFEWTVREDLPHSPEAVLAMQFVGNFFVAQSRENSRKFQSVDEENKQLIYNYSPTFTYVEGSDFQQSYFFSKYQA